MASHADSPIFVLLDNNATLREEMVRTLGSGRPPCWERVAIQLSIGRETVINCSWIDDVKHNSTSLREQGEEFVRKVAADAAAKITIGVFAKACDSAGLGRLAGEILEAALNLNPPHA